jgi:hypothetical protein
MGGMQRVSSYRRANNETAAADTSGTLLHTEQFQEQRNYI